MTALAERTTPSLQLLLTIYHIDAGPEPTVPGNNESDRIHVKLPSCEYVTELPVSTRLTVLRPGLPTLWRTSNSRTGEPNRPVTRKPTNGTELEAMENLLETLFFLLLGLMGKGLMRHDRSPALIVRTPLADVPTSLGE